MPRWLINIVVEIDLDKIRKNIVETRKMTPVVFMVKADAYGHGLTRVAKYVEDVVDAFGVETLQEGLRLRGAGIKSEILALALDENEIFKAYQNGLTIGLHNYAQLKKIECLIAQNRINPALVKMHVKVDSGMHRLGFCAEDLKSALSLTKRLNINVSAVYSHLRDGTEEQKSEFDKLANIAKKYYPTIKAHLASSHSLCNPNLRYDAVRLGIGGYEGAMSAYSQVIETRFVKAGEIVSYGNEILEKDANTAVIFGGYADGIARENPSFVTINGRKCEVLGNVCMDCFVVDTGDYVAKTGEKVVLFDGKNISDVALARRTIEYTVMTSLRGRIKRTYINRRN